MLHATGTTSLDIFFATLTCLLVFFLTIGKKTLPKGLRLPPGPRGKAFLGNVADLPTHHPWETFTRWAKEYGGLVYIKVLRQPLVFVNSVDIAQALFEKKSSIYSDRFDFPMLNDLMGFDWNFVLMRYGDKWRRHRKAFHLKFNPVAVPAYHEIQTQKTRNLLRRLHESPDDFIRHIRHLAGAIIMEIIYGIKVLPANDPYIQIAEAAFKAGSEAANPGAFLVDTLPILKYVPEWMPGAGFKTKARIWREIVTQMPIVPFVAAKKALNAGIAGPSFVTSLLEWMSSQPDASADKEEVIRNAGATAYGAGADTKVSALTSFILAMVQYPDAQRRAQAELDSVIGMDRLPTFEDRANLPYVNALCKEVHRWRPVFPLGIAHGLMQDDVYGDQFIPKGSIVVGNVFAMLHEEKVYGPKPEDFDPSRFLQPGVPGPNPAFGFGRRICPGRHLADHTVFIAVASILKVFDITHAKDTEGNEIPVAGTYNSGAISHPDPFRCSIKPRSASAESLILECTTD